MSDPVGFCKRWDDYDSFEAPATLFEKTDEEYQHSLASCANIIVANIHNTTMESGAPKWIKIPAILLLDAALLLVVPLLAAAEAAVRLALAIITLPMLLLACCSDTDWAMLPVGLALSTVHTLVQIANAFISAYLLLTSPQTIDAKDNGYAMSSTLTCGLINS